MRARTGILIILDGFGINPDSSFNAVALAKTPTLDRLAKEYCQTQLNASESHVGLPRGFMGNSEVGHLNIGAGRIVYQDFSLISHAIEEGSFFENPALTKVCAEVAKTGKNTLHLMGLVSDGGVHSHISHLFALIQLAKGKGVSNIVVHVFTDGRDTSPTSGVHFVEKLQSFVADSGVGKIGTVSGRFYAMDRDNRWERTQIAYDAVVCGKSPRSFDNALGYVRACYQENLTDEFLPPAIAKDYKGMNDGDGVIFFNFRADRARQLTRAITFQDFAGFKREKVPFLVDYVTLTPYDESFKVSVAYGKPKIQNTLGEEVAKQGWKQLRIAETEKYAHVTYFFNGGDEKTFPGEKRVLIPSPRDVKTYDLRPQMSALEVTQSLLKELSEDDYKFVVVNFANCDMVGHTGNLRAAIAAVEVVDGCLGRILDWVESNDAFAVITADHGNCESMQAPDGLPLTSHTLLPVPFIVVDPKHPKYTLLADGRLCDIAPTLCSLFGLSQPASMTGHSLISK